ncbi:hypothetical protein DFJ73DRAFT_778483 [Zopfochytrium polystomum]|nr:hypothetical protein DFJ73DRAFT_778483 [Zopfochytrium polystomum]
MSCFASGIFSALSAFLAGCGRSCGSSYGGRTYHHEMVGRTLQLPCLLQERGHADHASSHSSHRAPRAYEIPAGPGGWDPSASALCASPETGLVFVGGNDVIVAIDVDRGSIEFVWVFSAVEADNCDVDTNLTKAKDNRLHHICTAAAGVAGTIDVLAAGSDGSFRHFAASTDKQGRLRVRHVRIFRPGARPDRLAASDSSTSVNVLSLAIAHPIVFAGSEDGCVLLELPLGAGPFLREQMRSRLYRASRVSSSD